VRKFRLRAKRESYQHHSPPSTPPLPREQHFLEVSTVSTASFPLLSLLRRAGGAVILSGLAACGSAIGAFGVDRGQPADKADALFIALATRFGVAYRDPRFEAIRPRMVRHALTPSRLYPDTTIWTSISGDVRTVSVAGQLVGDRYALAAQAAVAPPARPGESRHVMHLRPIAPAVYRWDSTDEVAVGNVSPDEIMAIVGGLIVGAEQPSERIQTEYRAEFPRTTTALSKLFVLDSLQTTPADDGSTAIVLAARVDAARMRPVAPHFADYLDEYLKPLRIDIALIDQGGRSWGTVGVSRNTVRLRVRVHGGTLQPLSGITSDQPDSLRLRASFFAKVLFFNVGATEIVADVVPVREAGARGWSLRFRREPRWHFPLAVGRLLRATLRRPFAGDGTRVEFIAQETQTGQTVLARNIGIVVQESAIVRWIGGLGATAMGDLSVLAEQEKDRFVGDVFRALAEDSRAFLSP